MGRIMTTHEMYILLQKFSDELHTLKDASDDIELVPGIYVSQLIETFDSLLPGWSNSYEQAQKWIRELCEYYHDEEKCEVPVHVYDAKNDRCLCGSETRFVPGYGNNAEYQHCICVVSGIVLDR